jgi:hypothetical protein
MKRSVPHPVVRRLASVVLVCFAALAIALPSSAAPKKKEDPNYRQVQYRKAHEAMQAKKWDEARLLLLDLWRRARTYDVAASLGQAEYWLKNYGAGARYIVFALENLPPGEDSDTVRRLNAGLAELKKHVGAFKVVVDEPGAEVVLDTELVGTAPLASVVYVDPGPHSVEARSPGKPPVEVKVEAVVGETYTLELRTETPRVPRGSSATAPRPTSPSPAAATSDAGAPPAAVKQSRSVVPLLVTGGIALSAAGAGVAFTLFANDRSARIEELGERVGPSGCHTVQTADCRKLADHVDRRDLDRRLALASFVTSGVAVATSVVYLLFPVTRSQGAEVGVAIEPGGALLNVGGRL